MKVVAGVIIRKYCMANSLIGSTKLHMRTATNLEKSIEMQKEDCVKMSSSFQSMKITLGSYLVKQALLRER